MAFEYSTISYADTKLIDNPLIIPVGQYNVRFSPKAHAWDAYYTTLSDISGDLTSTYGYGMSSLYIVNVKEGMHDYQVSVRKNDGNVKFFRFRIYGVTNICKGAQQ